MTTQKRALLPAVQLERVIPSPPSDVYRAWLDPALLQRWMAPGFKVIRAEVDARVGGHLRIWHADDRGSDLGGFECEIVQLVPDERIVFRWGFVGPQRTAGPVYDSLLTISLKAAKGNATVLTLLHERLDDLAAAMPAGAAQVEAGWEMVLDKLGTLLRDQRLGTALAL